MATNRYIEVIFPIQCLGRTETGGAALVESVTVEVKACQSPGDEKNISLQVECIHNTGSHSQRCKASHPPGVDKVGDGVNCPYSLDIPYAFDVKSHTP